MTVRADNRGRAWDKAILHTLLAGSGLQIGMVLASVVSLPFVTRSLTPVEYGVYATLIGFSALLVFADLGVGSALTNRLTLWGSDDGGLIVRSISTAIAIAGGAGVAISILGVIASVALPWPRILGAEALGDSGLALAVSCSAIATGIGIAGSLGNRILYGLQRGRAANIWQLVGVFFAATFSIIAALLDAPLFVFVICGAGCPAITAVCCLAWALGPGSVAPKPSVSAVSTVEMRALTGAGSWFLLIAIFSAFGYHTDVLVVAAILGAAQAGTFSVTMSLFGIITHCLYPALLQLWPALGEAYRRGDISWIVSRLRWSTAIAVAASSVAGIVLVVTGRWLVDAWLTDGLVPPKSLLVVFALWTCLSLASAPLMLFLNAAGKVRAHAMLAVAVGAANLPSSILLTKELGIVGPVLASLVVQAILLVVPGAIIVAKVIAKSTDAAGGAGGQPIRPPEPDSGEAAGESATGP